MVADLLALPESPIAPDAEPFPAAVAALTAFSYQTTDPDIWITAVMCPHGEQAIRRWHLREPGMERVDERGRQAVVWWRRAVCSLACDCGAGARQQLPVALPVRTIAR